MIEYKLDIPSLTEDGIQMEDSFYDVKELNSSSMIDLSIIIKMLILLIDSFDRRVIILGIVDIQNDCMMCKWIVFVDNDLYPRFKRMIHEIDLIQYQQTQSIH